jgi:hypothetical protein
MKDGELKHELLADMMLKDYMDALEKENQVLKEKLKGYEHMFDRSKPKFHKNIIKKGEIL